MRCGRPPRTPAYSGIAQLLPGMRSDGLFNLPLYGIKIEARWRLHRRIFDSRLRQLSHFPLDQHKAPELASHEVVHVTTTHVVQALTAN